MDVSRGSGELDGNVGDEYVYEDDIMGFADDCGDFFTQGWVFHFHRVLLKKYLWNQGPDAYQL